MNFYPIIKPLLFKLSEETAHDLAIWWLKKRLYIKQKIISHESLKTNICGITFNNPIGLAAGFDKNAEAIDGLFDQGFGFLELGTVTPLPQSGNPKPRLFRLEEDKAIINRMGFNSLGIDQVLSNLNNTTSNPIGLNIGKNREGHETEDYLTLLKKCRGRSDYITINISSPNTPGLRDLHHKEKLVELLKTINSIEKPAPLFLKISPDLKENELFTVVDTALDYNIDGFVISNTTISHREILMNINRTEEGGLSGKPLFEPSNKVLAKVYKHTKGKVPLIGVGGIMNAHDAYTKIKAGASLIQLYTGLIYNGFKLVRDISNSFPLYLEKDGFKHVSEAVGTNI